MACFDLDRKQQLSHKGLCPPVQETPFPTSLLPEGVLMLSLVGSLLRCCGVRSRSGLDCVRALQVRPPIRCMHMDGIQCRGELCRRHATTRCQARHPRSTSCKSGHNLLCKLKNGNVRRSLISATQRAHLWEPLWLPGQAFDEVYTSRGHRSGSGLFGYQQASLAGSEGPTHKGSSVKSSSESEKGDVGCERQQNGATIALKATKRFVAVGI